MTLKKIRGGDRFKTGQVNQFVDEFDLLKSSRTGRRLDRNLMPGNPVWAVNKGSTDLLMGEVAAIDSTPYVGNATGLVTDNVVLTLRDTEEGDEGHWVVAANFIPIDEAGWVYTGGVCLARLEPGASGSIPGSLVEMMAGEKYLEVGSTGTGQLIEDLAQEATSGAGEWGLIRFGVGSASAEPPVDPVLPGDTIPIITDEAGSVGGDLLYRRNGTRGGFKLRAAKPGVRFEAAAAGFGVKWATSQAEIEPVSDAVNAVGDLDLIAHSNHRHKLFAGNGLAWANVGDDRVLAMSPGTKGDTWYYNGSWLKRGIGSAGDVLTVSGDLPTWATLATLVQSLLDAGTVVLKCGANATKVTDGVNVGDLQDIIKTIADGGGTAQVLVA